MAVINSKSPSENLILQADWTAELALNAADAIDTFAWVLPEGLENEDESTTDALTEVEISGNVPAEYMVTATIETTAGHSYSKMFIVVVEAPVSLPANGYASVVSISRELGVTDEEGIKRLSEIIVMASRWVDAYCGRKFYYEEDIEEVVTPTTNKSMFVDRSPLVSIASIEYDSEELDELEYDIFEASAGLIRHADSWMLFSAEEKRYTVTYTGGFKLPGQAGRNLPYDIEYFVTLVTKSVYYAQDRDPSLKQASIPQVINLEFFGPASNGKGNSEFFQGLSMLKKYKRVSL